MWQQYSGTDHTGTVDIRASRYTVGSGWDAATIIDNSDYNAYEPKVALDTSGNALVVWSQGNAIYQSDVMVNRYIAGTGWSTPSPLESDSTLYAGTPQVSVNANGTAMAIWQLENDDTEIGSIWSNRFEKGI